MAPRAASPRAASSATATRRRSPPGSEQEPSRIPVLVNAHPGFDERIHATVEASDDAPAQLRPSLGSLPLEGGTFRRYHELPETVLSGLTYHRVQSIDTTLDAVWPGSNGLGFTSGSLVHPAVDESQQLLQPITFSGSVPSLAAQPASGAVDDVTYEGPLPWFQNPTDESAETPFHPLQRLREASDLVAPWHAFDVIGRYDPGCVSRRSKLFSSAFDIYSNPDTTFEGRTLGPNAAMTNFVAPMPLVMTSLAGGRFFSDRRRFSNGLGDAFLSMVRVKVGGTSQPGTQSQSRLEQVAAEIHRRTGLVVDIVKGSSTEKVSIDLAPGRFGRRAMTVQQDWLAEHVGITFFNAISRTSLLMTGVVAVVAALLAGQTAYATVRRRRTELLLLRALGWPARRVGWLVEAELVALGVAIAGVASLSAAAFLRFGHPDADVARWIVAAGPIGLALTALSGVAPAIGAARTRALTGLRGPGRLRRRRPRVVTPLRLGVREALTTWRWQTLLGVLATGVGSLFLGAVLAISQQFRSSLDASALAQQLAAEVTPFDIVLGVTAVLLAAVTVVSVMLVATRERLPHLATLRALGWSQGHVGRVVAGQAMTVGLIGGGMGTAGLWLLGRALRQGLAMTPWNLLSPLALGGVCGAAAAGAALSVVYRRVPVAVLRDV